jgi:DNA-binding Xre family transcriptional regulator
MPAAPKKSPVTKENYDLGRPVSVRGPKPRKRSGATTPANLVIARNLHRLRTARGLTQVQLCDFAVVDRSFYQRVEACTENVTIEYLEKLRPVLKCSWADIFKGLD